MKKRKTKAKVKRKSPKRKTRKSNFTGSVSPTPGGLIHFTNGVMDYCDDGKGNEWSADDDFYSDMDTFNDDYF